ncbi:hypothetical protein GDO78_018683 [Eleutherodactylus coqui]|uniref:Reverse transcriptase n=1 Tax=Eleutherodactylus coqui TaxID=57060 RepID=A0A8J6BK96_ELECQ|nr:hypothetical protein GDO78_018683 [Eleutherodactylus coqui]
MKLPGEQEKSNKVGGDQMFLSTKKGKQVDPGNYRPVSLTSIPGKIFEQIIKQHVCKYLDKNGEINQSPHGFVTNESCQTNPISFYDKITDWVDQGNAVDIVYL